MRLAGFRRWLGLVLGVGCWVLVLVVAVVQVLVSVLGFVLALV